MRIIRGKLKSRRIKVPKGFSSRPTTNFAKEGLFNVIDNHFDMEDKEILDLCSGTGNISLEFVSNYAKHVLAVEKSFPCTQYLKSVSKDLNIQNELTVLKSEVISFLKKTEKSFDLIFADPPYDATFHQEILDQVIAKNMVKENGWLIIEHGKQTTFSLEPDLQKKYGAVYFSFFPYRQLSSSNH